MNRLVGNEAWLMFDNISYITMMKWLFHYNKITQEEAHLTS